MNVHQPFKLDEKPSGQTDQVKQRRFLLQRRILVEHAGVLEPAAERMASGRHRRDMSFVTARCMLTGSGLRACSSHICTEFPSQSDARLQEGRASST